MEMPPSRRRRAMRKSDCVSASESEEVGSSESPRRGRGSGHRLRHCERLGGGSLGNPRGSAFYGAAAEQEPAAA